MDVVVSIADSKRTCLSDYHPANDDNLFTTIVAGTTQEIMRIKLRGFGGYPNISNDVMYLENDET